MTTWASLVRGRREIRANLRVARAALGLLLRPGNETCSRGFVLCVGDCGRVDAGGRALERCALRRRVGGGERGVPGVSRTTRASKLRCLPDRPVRAEGDSAV